MQRRREVREREEVVKLRQLRRRVHGLLTASASASGRRLTGRPGLGRLGRGRGSIWGSGLLLRLLRPECGGARDDVEQPAHVRDGELLRVVLCARRTGRRGADQRLLAFLRFRPREVGYSLILLTFDDAEVARLEGGDLHRVLELGPTDLHCARRNETRRGCQLRARISRQI